MLTRVYWILRILGYAITLPAAIVFLNAKYGGNPVLAERTKVFLGIGFACFIVSYVIYVIRRIQRRY